MAIRPSDEALKEKLAREHWIFVRRSRWALRALLLAFSVCLTITDLYHGGDTWVLLLPPLVLVWAGLREQLLRRLSPKTASINQSSAAVMQFHRWSWPTTMIFAVLWGLTGLLYTPVDMSFSAILWLTSLMGGVIILYYPFKMYLWRPVAIIVAGLAPTALDLFLYHEDGDFTMPAFQLLAASALYFSFSLVLGRSQLLRFMKIALHNESLVDYLERSRDEIRTANAHLLAERDETKRLANRIQSMLDASPDPMAIVETETAELIETNKAFSQIARKSAISKNTLFGKLRVTRKDIRSLRRMVRQAAASPKRAAKQTEISVQIRGEDHPMEVRAVRLSENRQDQALVVIRDLKSLREMEMRMMHSQRLESVGRLASSIAHEFNNTLSVITCHAQIVADENDLSDDVKADLETIAEAAMRAATFTRQLLGLNRNAVVRPEDVPASEIIEKVYKFCRPLIPESIDLSMDLAESEAQVHVDPAMLQQVVMNLVINARDAIDYSGRITIRSRMASEAEQDNLDLHDLASPVCFEVEDDGSGIPDAALAKIFEPFYTTKAVGEGTGLGLHYVKSTVEQFGGQLRVASVVGSGTTFQVYLPAVQTQTSPQLKVVPNLKALPSGADERRILVVEDEETLLPLLTRFLQKNGLNVLPASSPDEALLVANTLGMEIDILVTDFVLPRMSGLELSQSIAMHSPQVQTIFTSGYPAAELERQGLPPGYTPFIQKPYQLQAIYEAIHDLLDASKAVTQESAE